MPPKHLASLIVHPVPVQFEGQQTGRGGPADPVITPGGARRDAAATTGQLGAQGGQQPRPDDPTATGGGEEGACRVCAAAAAITLVLVGTESRGQQGGEGICRVAGPILARDRVRSEEHTSELQ